MVVVEGGEGRGKGRIGNRSFCVVDPVREKTIEEWGGVGGGSESVANRVCCVRVKIYKSMHPFFLPDFLVIAAFVAVWNTSCTPFFSFAEHSR